MIVLIAIELYIVLTGLCCWKFRCKGEQIDERD